MIDVCSPPAWVSFDRDLSVEVLSECSTFVEEILLGEIIRVAVSFEIGSGAGL